jgi:hypothetical protein
MELPPTKGGLLKSLMLLWSKLANECASRCCTSATLDINRVECRVKHEGLSFLTITLPAIAKALEKGLNDGRVDRHQFTGFRCSGELPLLLGGFLDRVFDRCSGRLLDDPCIDAIRSVRQLSLVFGKIEIPCSDARIRDAMRRFIENEEKVKTADAARSRGAILDFKRVSSLLFRDVFTSADRAIFDLTIVPKHGPGATADRLLGNRKYDLCTWTERLEKILPAGEMILPSWSYYDSLDDVTFLDPGAEVPVRVIAVPKTLKTPRIIGIEPTAMQYSQQAILPLLTGAIERDSILSSLIGFDDQTLNQEMALEGSLTGDLCTLDLSDASDLVSNQLVREMTDRWPHLHMAIDASRSRKADVQGHGVLRLAKFASMGSALTFPIEAMVFMTVICLGIEDALNRPLSRQDLRGLMGRVRIYGDDIIVPRRFVRPVVGRLRAFGFVVNRDKSFWNGKFRESCGREFYAGEDVSIVRVRQELPSHREHATRIISTVSLRNQLYQAGYWQTCRWLDDLLEDLLRYYPVVASTSRVLGRLSFLGYQTDGMDAALHRPYVKGWVESSVSPSSILDDKGALLKFHLSRARELENLRSWLDGQPAVDKWHLVRAGRPVAVNIKLRNASPF